MAHTATWNAAYEADPADSDNVSAGAQDIRELKRDVRERIAKDHYMAVAGTDADHGEHSKVTFQAPLGADPAPGTNKGALYTKDVSAKAELHFQDEDGDVVQLTSGGAMLLLAESGTVMVFGQASAPTGWTKKTDWQDKAMFTYSGDADGTALDSGGSAAAQTVHTHTYGTIAHTHVISASPAGYERQGNNVVLGGQAYGSSPSTESTGTATSPTGANTAFYYQELIVCTKD